MLALGGAGRAQESAASGEKTTEKKALTPEAFLELRQVQDPQFSPDGTRVAFVVSDPFKNDKRTLHIWLYDGKTKSARQLTYSDKSDSVPRWSPDGQKLAFLSNRGGEYQQLYILRMEGGEGVALTKAKASVSVFAWSPDGQSIAFISPDPKTDEDEKKEKDKDDAHVVDKEDKQPRLRVIDLKSKEERALTKPNWMVSELVWMPDGQAIVMSATDRPASDQNTHRIYAVSVKAGAMKELAAPHGPFAELQISPSGALVSYQGCREDGPQPHDLMLLPSSGGAPRNLTGASLDRMIVDYKWLKGGSLLVTYAEGFKTRFTSYSSEGERKEIGELPVNAEQFSVASTGAAAFIGEATTSPRELWIREADGSVQQASHVNEAWKSYAVTAPEYYKYKSTGDLEIETALLKPAGYDGKSKLPTVVLVHGGPTGNWEDRVDAWGQLLVARGYLVMYPNIRGSIGYGQKFIEMNRADWGGGDFQDVEKGVDDLVAKGFADPDRLGIGGWSYGGYMSEWAVTQTARYKAAVSGAGMANLISEYGSEQHPSYDEWFYGVPYETPEGFLNSSPFLFVKNAKTPTLILQGQADTVDPLGQSQELYRGLKRYGVDAEFVEYPREPHGFQEAKHRVDVSKRVVDWFDRYLKEAKPAKGGDKAGE
jgi:dipeptidyl aminopeptidase/acylaminoacyl peptidase